MMVACSNVSLEVERWLHSILILKVEPMGFVWGLEISHELNREIKILDLNMWENRITFYRDGEGSRRSRYGVKSRVLIYTG